MTEILVNREIWHRGKEASTKDAFIYNSETGKMDIVGIILAALGVHHGYMDKARLPSTAAHMFLPSKRKFQAPFEWLVTQSHADTPETIELIKHNDDPSYKEEEREEKIKSFLAFRGIVAAFYDSETVQPFQTVQTVQRRRNGGIIDDLDLLENDLEGGNDL